MRRIDSDMGQDAAKTTEEIARPVALQFDPARYRAELDAFDITEAQKQELLATLWSIMCSFVELGFSVDVCSALLSEHVPSIPDDDGLR